MDIPDEVLSKSFPPYAELEFGKSDARTERRTLPNLFRSSYIDKGGIAKKVASYECCLVLGPKGAGKSALGYHLVDSSKTLGCKVAVVNATNLPMSEIPKIRTGQREGSERSTTTWRFILLINLIRLMNENGVHFKDGRQVRAILEASTDLGIPQNTSSMRDISRLVSTETRIPSTNNLSVSIFQSIPTLLEIIKKAHSDSGHILVLDGLDSIFLNDDRYTESLASLVQATYLLNQDLRDFEIPGSIVLLLRDDLFSRISHHLPDIQKFRSDMGESLDWRILSGATGVNAPLFKLVNAKASLPPNLHILDYFPDKIDLAGGHKRVDKIKYLLNMTRHTPRDILALFQSIKDVAAEGSFEMRTPVLTQEVIREGILKYSTEYFINAVTNEFAGSPGAKDLSVAGINTLRALQKQAFTFEEFSNELRETSANHQGNERRILEMLFFAGAIGNVVPAKKGEVYVQFSTGEARAKYILRER